MFKLFILITLVGGTFGNGLLVETNEGPVQGYKNEETGLYEFFGIPYATVPTGNDKFKAPLPAPNRTYVFEATNYAIFCPQNENTLPGEYQEQCLVINVYVPDTNMTSYPVVVYVHGGAFVNGYGNQYSPESIASKDVIGVTFNYRLGAHGFLCLRTDTAPGNAGLKDQRSALRWIQENIAEFGGNPSDVTVAGYSAGAATAEILMLSTKTPLFDKLILESGSGLASFALKENPVEFAKEFAALLGATDIQVASVQELEQFYMSLSFDEMFANVDLKGVPIGFSPCVENSISDLESIIEENPIDILRNGSYHKMPVLTGYTNGEGLIFYENRDIWLPKMATNLPEFFPTNFNLKLTATKTDVARQINEVYFPHGFEHENVSQEFVNYFTDSMFMYGVLQSARLHAEHSDVFLYEFSFSGSLDLYHQPQLGAGHCAQTVYVLNNRQEEVLNANDVSMRNQIVELWTNFIKYGDPVVNTSQSGIWQKLNNTRMNYLQIDLQLSEHSWPRKGYMEFWEKMWTIKEEEKGAANLMLPGFMTLAFSGILLVFLTK